MAWFNASWPNRFAVTSDHTKVEAAIDNVVYDLANAPAGFWSAVRSDGGDLRVTQSDGTTELAREVSGFNQGATVGHLWFAASGLSTLVDTTYYVYFGNASATEPAVSDPNGKNAVWSSHLAVFHLDDAASPAVDSKSGVSATQANGVTFGAAGKLRGGCSFDGADDKLNAGNNVGITAASLTISAWINPIGLGEVNGGRIVQKCPSGTDLNGYRFNLNTNSGLALVIGDASATTTVNSTNTIVTLSALQLVSVTYDGANARFYVNGDPFGAPALTRVPTNAGASFVIGNDTDGTIRSFNGIIDEVRVATSVRSETWLTTEYFNQNNPATFWTTGGTESAYGYLLVKN